MPDANTRPEWIDRHGKPHPLTITAAQALQIRNRTGIDLLKCLVDIHHIDNIVKTISVQIELLMVACAVIEGIGPAEEHKYFDLWDGTSFETAGRAFLEAMADFFPQRPKTLLRQAINKIQKAQQTVGDRAIKLATKALDEIDFTSLLTNSATRGSGGSGSAVSSA